jgi:NADPH:quinone reductase-like Zn-dependent oxidoreductase
LAGIKKHYLMRSYHLEAFKTIEGIQIKEHPIPQPGRPGVIPLSDGAGEIIAVGNAVSRFMPGDKVCGNYFAHWRDGSMGSDITDQLGCTLDGMLTEYALLKEDSLVHIPAHHYLAKGEQLGKVVISGPAKS